MSDPPTPADRRRQAALMKTLNVPVRVLLGLPVPTPLGSRLMLVFHTGRRTGRHYRQPVSYVAHDGALLTPGGGRWTLNLKEGEPTRIRLRGRDISARPEIVTDPGLVETLLGVMRAANPSLDRFVRLPKTPNGRYERPPLKAAIGHGFRVVRWHLDEGPAPVE